MQSTLLHLRDESLWEFRRPPPCRIQRTEALDLDSNCLKPSSAPKHYKTRRKGKTSQKSGRACRRMALPKIEPTMTLGMYRAPEDHGDVICEYINLWSCMCGECLTVAKQTVLHCLRI